MNGLASNAVIANIAEYIYRVDPRLRPFNGGDLAKRFGRESAIQFAARKWAESAIAKECSMAKARSEKGKKSYRRRAASRKSVQS